MQLEKMRKNPPKVLISGYYGFNNFGDEAVLSVLVNNLKESRIKDITVFSKNPEFTEKTYDVKSVNSFNLAEIFFSMMKTDFLISGGGSLLQDVTSAKSLIYYLFIILLALIFGKKVIIFAQGIGPINNKFLRAVTAFALKKCKYVTVRDEKSLNQMQKWGIKADLVSDPVWSLKLKRKYSHHAVGIQLRKWEGLTDELLQEWAKYVYETYNDKIIFIYALQKSLDLDICLRFEEILRTFKQDMHIHVVTNRATFEIVTAFSHLDEMIAMRYHACLLGLKYGIKVLPIVYDPKVEKLADEFEITERLSIKGETDAKNKIHNLRYGEYHANFDKVSEKLFNFEKFKQALFEK